MKDFRDLQTWQKAHRLALDVYKATGKFPREEAFGLTAQMRRAGVSIPANIAEGCGRRGDNELRRFLDIAMGSASELECLLLLAGDLGMLQESSCDRLSEQTVEVKKMLASFCK